MRTPIFYSPLPPPFLLSPNSLPLSLPSPSYPPSTAGPSPHVSGWWFVADPATSRASERAQNPAYPPRAAGGGRGGEAWCRLPGKHRGEWGAVHGVGRELETGSCSEVKWNKVSAAATLLRNKNAYRLNNTRVCDHRSSRRGFICLYVFFLPPPPPPSPLFLPHRVVVQPWHRLHTLTLSHNQITQLDNSLQVLPALHEVSDPLPNASRHSVIGTLLFCVHSPQFAI